MFCSVNLLKIRNTYCGFSRESCLWLHSDILLTDYINGKDNATRHDKENDETIHKSEVNSIQIINI